MVSWGGKLKEIAAMEMIRRISRRAYGDCKCCQNYEHLFGGALDVSQLIVEEFSERWESILNKYEKHVNSQEILHVVVFGLWSLWKTRNSAVFEGTITNPTIMVISLQAQVQEYRVAQMLTKPLINELPCPQDCAQSVPNSWTKPAHGWVKANCDRAWLNQTQKGGAG
ncbi:unnamed protein product [Prunus armeniaca]